MQEKKRKSCKRGPKIIFSTKIIRNGHNKLSLVPRSHHICSEFEKKTPRCTFRRQKRRISCERRPKHKISTKTMKCGHNKLCTSPRSHFLSSEFEKKDQKRWFWEERRHIWCERRSKHKISTRTRQCGSYGGSPAIKFLLISSQFEKKDSAFPSFFFLLKKKLGFDIMLETVFNKIKIWLKKSNWWTP